MKTQKRKSLVYGIVDTPRKTGKISELKYQKGRGRRPDSYIEIAKWKNWEHSYLIRFVQDGQSVIIDSSVIDELHDKLKFLPLVKGFELERGD
jgi:hypothetical protein